MPTDPRRGFELMFRLYGPKKEFFDKAWELPDTVRVEKRVIAAARRRYTMRRSDSA